MEMLTSVPKLSFDTGGEFIRQTRREVDAYLSDPRTRARGRAELYAKGVVAFVVLLGSWLILVLGHPSLWLGLLCFGGLILGTSLIAFSVMHDANHGAYFRTRRLNHLMGWTADALLGLSSYAWRVKHNVAHHTYTNVDGYDADITQVPLARLVPGQRPRALVPAAALLHLGAVLLDGAPLADGRRCRRLRSRKHRDEHLARASPLGSSRSRRRKGDLRRLGDHRADARLSVVGRGLRLCRLLDDREPDHGCDLPARTLRRGG